MAATPRVRDAVLSHPALLASLGVVALSMLRVLIFAGMDVPVALAILSVGDRTGIVASTLLSAAVVLAPFVILMKGPRRWILAGNEVGSSFWVKLRTAFIWIPLAYLLLGILSPLLISSLALGTSIAWYFNRRTKMRYAQITDQQVLKLKIANRADTTYWMLATLAGLYMFYIIAQPWQPLEVLKFQTVEEPQVVYVIGAQADQLLTVDRHKSPSWMPIGELETRTICTPIGSSWYARPLIKLISDPALATCPELGPKAQESAETDGAKPLPSTSDS